MMRAALILSLAILLAPVVSATGHGYVVSPTSLITIMEGEDASISISLATQPTADVVLNRPALVGFAHCSATTTYTTANWATPVACLYSSTQDSQAQGDRTVTPVVTVTSADPAYDGTSVPMPSIRVIDDDVAGIVVFATSCVASYNSPCSVNVRLASEPTCSQVVVVPTYSISGQASLSGNLQFTPADWNVNQAVVVSMVSTQRDGATINGQVVLTGLGCEYEGNAVATTVAVRHIALGTFVVTPSSGSTVNAYEGGADGVILIHLTSQPNYEVTIQANTMQRTDIVTMAPSYRIFTTANWNVDQAFTFHAIEDSINQNFAAFRPDYQSGSADVSYDGLLLNAPLVQVIDNDVAQTTTSTSTTSTTTTTSSSTSSATTTSTLTNSTTSSSSDADGGGGGAIQTTPVPLLVAAIAVSLALLIRRKLEK